MLYKQYLKLSILKIYSDRRPDLILPYSIL